MYLYPTEQGERLNRLRLDSSPLGLFRVNSKGPFKQGKKAFGHSAARFLKAKSNRLMCCIRLIIGVRK